MKLYAQHGHAPADKMLRAINEGFINGVILSPRYLKPDSSTQIITELKEQSGEIDLLMDPEFYATRYIGTPNAQLGYLEEWNYFRPRRQNELLVGSNSIDEVLRESFEMQRGIGCTRLIAPNIYITSSFDSIEAAIAISFITRTKPIADEMGIDLPVYATLAVYRDAIVDQQNFLSFLNAITAIDPFPIGVYSLVGAGPTDERIGTVRSEIITSDVIAGWMLFNYSLSLNGIEVINGFSDILTPLLGAAGGYAGSTGWWSNLQVFSMGRYIRRAGGGQLPVIKYLSKKLFNRITISEREAFVEVISDIMNNISTDTLYEGGEPTRTEEALQTWQSIMSLNHDVISNDINESLTLLSNCLTEAEQCYIELQTLGFSDRFETNMEYLSAIRNSLEAFRQLAEL